MAALAMQSLLCEREEPETSAPLPLGAEAISLLNQGSRAVLNDASEPV